MTKDAIANGTSSTYARLAVPLHQPADPPTRRIGYIRRMRRRAGSVTAVAFDRSAPTYVTMDNVCQRLNRERSSCARSNSSTVVSEKSSDRTSRRSVIHATDSNA